MSTQTTDAVNNIGNIVNEINDAVSQMSDCLSETTSFLEKNVLSDYIEFGKVSEQYKVDANTFGDSMKKIKDNLEILNKDMDMIVDAISGMDFTVNESSTGVSNIAEKTYEMVDRTSGSIEKVNECKNAVSNLKDIIDKFSL